MKSEWYYKSYCVPKDCHKWNRFMGQEILRGNLADFGFALHCTTKILNRTENFKNKKYAIITNFHHFHNNQHFSRYTLKSNQMLTIKEDLNRLFIQTSSAKIKHS